MGEEIRLPLGLGQMGRTVERVQGSACPQQVAIDSKNQHRLKGFGSEGPPPRSADAPECQGQRPDKVAGLHGHSCLEVPAELISRVLILAMTLFRVLTTLHITTLNPKPQTLNPKLPMNLQVPWQCKVPLASCFVPKEV